MVINSLKAPEVNKLSPFYQLYVLLNTVRGTVPLERDLGIDARLTDKPITIIENVIQAELQGQIDKYIKRLRLLDVTCTLSDMGLMIECEVELK
ncbi:hypothetical protein [Fusobacterium varium]|uniref:hypothetical protein n=1 Tax=Fusobacterium varium TaxID=856 RepID=UPI00266DBA59|nr:hypothetical protein [Fusobacterium varium]